MIISDGIWSEKVRCSSKMKPKKVASRVDDVKSGAVHFGKLLFESDEQEFNLRAVES